MRWDTTSRRRGGSLLLNSINLVEVVLYSIYKWSYHYPYLSVASIAHILIIDKIEISTPKRSDP